MGGVLIIGYGNPLRGDDGLGWRACEELRRLLPEAEVRVVHQLTPELAEPVSRARLAVFIDAGADGLPGEVRMERIEPAGAPTSFTHHVGTSMLLGMARALYGAAPRAVLYSISGETFDCGDQLSAVVREALPRLVASVLAISLPESRSR